MFDTGETYLAFEAVMHHNAFLVAMQFVVCQSLTRYAQIIVSLRFYQLQVVFCGYAGIDDNGVLASMFVRPAAITFSIISGNDLGSAVLPSSIDE